MSDQWRRFDAEVAQRGILHATELLSDLELLALLGSDEEPARQVEKRLLREEAYRRLQGARSGVPASTRPGGNPEPMEHEMGAPNAGSRMPDQRDYKDPF